MIKERCPWANTQDFYQDYHDIEWGNPFHDDHRHFEFLFLETMQAGLSWRIILQKRNHFKLAFDNFDVNKIANYSPDKIDSLMTNSNIIRNRKKLESSVKNAKAFISIQKEFSSFDNYIWSFTNRKQIINSWKSVIEIPVKNELSDRISNDLKKRGFAFVGSVTIYSHLQAIGVINDHLVTCFRYKQVQTM